MDMDMYRDLTQEDYNVAAMNGITRDRVRQRVNYSEWPISLAITEPTKQTNPHKWWMDEAAKNGITLSRRLVLSRKEAGWTDEEIVKTDVGEPRHGGRWEIDRKYAKIAAENGIGNNTYHGRRRAGWTRHRASTQKVDGRFRRMADRKR